MKQCTRCWTRSNGLSIGTFAWLLKKYFFFTLMYFHNMGSKTVTKPPLAPRFQRGSAKCVTIRRLTLVHLRTPVIPYWSTKFMWFHDFGVKQTSKNASPPRPRPPRSVKVGQSPHLCIVFGQGVYKGEFQQQPCLEGCLGTLGCHFWQERKVQNSLFKLDEKPSHPQSL